MIKYDRDVVNTFIIQLFHLDSSLANSYTREVLASVRGKDVN